MTTFQESKTIVETFGEGGWLEILDCLLNDFIEVTNDEFVESITNEFAFTDNYEYVPERVYYSFYKHQPPGNYGVTGIEQVI
ncbi:hypothetical protein BB558_002367 [Smittium angustum]|uniref:Uncharacterized protein n=1 Tax=Smittium angustum TaxID=133377 RepID=A0A2U1J8X8_SMIAN|nr:hypothetical protein BB558_002367 [Smittium angustum]